MSEPKKQNKMTVFTLTMMTVAAVVSLRGLPLMAKEGLSMVFYILFSTIMFLLPASLVAAELGGAFGKEGGGVYTWVKEAFGSRLGFTAVWLQWIQNVVWYPTVLGFGAAALAYLLLDPALANQGLYTGGVILACYWGATIITLFGSKAASAVTKYGVLLGTVLPGIFIILLGTAWVVMGNPLEITGYGSQGFHARLFPHISGLGSLAFLGGIILLFAGVEVHAVHANELENPAKQFPESMFLAMLVIFLLFMLGSLSVAAVVPAKEISLTAGLLQAFKSLLDKFQLGFLTPVMGLLCAFGAIGGVMSWIDGPSRGLLATGKNGEIPPIMAKTNKKGVQVNILLLQAVIVSLLACLYFIMDDVSVAFFILSAMTITLYLVVYILMYAAAIKLRISRPDLERSYKVPGGILGMVVIAGMGLVGVCFAMVVSFFPPDNLPVGNPTLYVALVASGLVIFVGLAFFIQAKKNPGWMPGAKTDEYEEMEPIQESDHEHDGEDDDHI